MRAERDRLLAVKFVPLQLQDDQAGKGRQHRDDKKLRNTLDSDPEHACAEELDVAETETVMAAEPPSNSLC